MAEEVERAGLSSAEVQRRRADEGWNVLPRRRAVSPVRQLLAQLTHVLALLL